MSFVYDLRSTVAFSLFAAITLWFSLSAVLTGEPVEDWLSQVAIGVVFCAMVADGIQRRWRGDPRAREPGPDARTLAAGVVGFLALVPVGLWSYAQGHRLGSWGILTGGGLVGAAVLAWTWRGLEE